VNHSLSIDIKFKTPIEVWSNKPVKYLMLKVFGCPKYYHVSEGKLKPRRVSLWAMEMESKDSKSGLHLKDRSF